jgi:peptidyl-prolyl cis-trans isomerase A (cyclophilin A)
MRLRRCRLAAFVTAMALSFGCTSHPALTPAPVPIDPVAPDSFLVELTTSRGPIEILLRREWSPLGVDRFYHLVKHHFFDDARFFRVVPGFVAQFGLPADPRLTEKLARSTLPDEPVRHSNGRGALSFARAGSHTRSEQLFINLQDNAALDTLGGFGFPPIGEIVRGIDLIDLLNGEYDEFESPEQDSIRAQGNRYLNRLYPRLDYIRTIKILHQWR